MLMKAVHSGSTRGAAGPLLASFYMDSEVAARSRELDTEVIERFKAQVDEAGGSNCQSLVSGALKPHIQRLALERTLRKLIREEQRRMA